MPISLDPISYAQQYELCKNASTMTSAAIDWFKANSDTWLSHAEITDKDKATFSVLSVGSGVGDIDFAVINMLLAQHRPTTQTLKYIALEPNPIHYQKFQKQLHETNWDSTVDVSIRQDYFNAAYAANIQERFDLIIMAHSLYYFADPYATIQQILALTKPKGKVVIIHQTDLGLPSIRQAFQYNLDGMMPAAAIRQLLDHHQQPYQYVEIATKFDATECLKRSPAGLSLMSFCLEYDVQTLNETEMETLVNAFAQAADMQENGRLYMPESIGIFTLTSEQCDKL